METPPAGHQGSEKEQRNLENRREELEEQVR